MAGCRVVVVARCNAYQKAWGVVAAQGVFHLSMWMDVWMESWKLTQTEDSKMAKDDYIPTGEAANVKMTREQLKKLATATDGMHFDHLHIFVPGEATHAKGTIFVGLHPGFNMLQWNPTRLGWYRVEANESGRAD